MMEKNRLQKRVFIAAVFTLVLGAGFAFGQSAGNAFKRGEDFFMQNKPAMAAPLLEAAAREDPSNIKAYIYLGIAYHQLKLYDKSLAVYQTALPMAGENAASIAYNMGNVYFEKGDFKSAGDYYGRALENDPMMASAYLNRANSGIKSGDKSGAVQDYQAYIALAPDSPQRAKIEALIALVNEEQEAEERARLAAEEKARQERLIAEERARQEKLIAEEKARQEAERLRQEAERIRLEEERKRQEAILAEERARQEAERRQRLMDEVAASLQETAVDSKGVSAGAENVQGYEGEFELE
jgi:tetratricopeptide (TPR) repeat protein